MMHKVDRDTQIKNMRDDKGEMDAFKGHRATCVSKCKKKLDAGTWKYDYSGGTDPSRKKARQFTREK
eukprot:6779613-Pyramimonas_sp.AAC.1